MHGGMLLAISPLAGRSYLAVLSLQQAEEEVLMFVERLQQELMELWRVESPGTWMEAREKVRTEGGGGVWG